MMQSLMYGLTDLKWTLIMDFLGGYLPAFFGMLLCPVSIQMLDLRPNVLDDGI